MPSFTMPGGLARINIRDARGEPVLSGRCITMTMSESPYLAGGGYVTYDGVVHLETAHFLQRRRTEYEGYAKVTGKATIGDLQIQNDRRGRMLVDVRTWQIEIELHSEYPTGYGTLRGTFRWMDERQQPGLIEHYLGGSIDVSRWQTGTFSTASVQANATTEELVDVIFAEKKRAKELLMSDLNEEQLADYKQSERFNVTAKSGRVYRVLPLEQSNVNELDKNGKAICNWCLAQDTDEPIADLQYAIKKLIEWDEERFRKVAIPRGRFGRTLYGRFADSIMSGGVDFARGDNISVTLISGDTETDITEHVVSGSMYAVRPANAVPETEQEQIAQDAQAIAERTNLTLQEAHDRIVQAVGRQSEAYERLALVARNATQAIDAANVTWSALDSVGQLEQIYLVNEETGELIARIDNDEE